MENENRDKTFKEELADLFDGVSSDTKETEIDVIPDLFAGQKSVEELIENAIHGVEDKTDKNSLKVNTEIEEEQTESAQDINDDKSDESTPVNEPEDIPENKLETVEEQLPVLNDQDVPLTGEENITETSAAEETADEVIPETENNEEPVETKEEKEPEIIKSPFEIDKEILDETIEKPLFSIDDKKTAIQPVEPVEIETQETEKTEPETVQTETVEEEIKPEPVEIKEKAEKKSKREKDSKKIILIILVAMLLGVLGFVGARFLSKSPEKEVESIIEQEEAEMLNPMDKELRKMWLTNKQINEDYIGEIIFESGLLQESVVQAKDVYKNGKPYKFYTEDGVEVSDPSNYSGNDVYIWTDWKNGKPVDRNTGIGGSTFLDYRNSLAEPVQLVWGHHWARDYMENKGIEGLPNFTALDVLMDSDNYEENKNFIFVLDNEIRTYVVGAVYQIDVNKEEDIRLIIDLEPTEESLLHILRTQLYKTGVSMHSNDYFLALCTCIQHDPNHREIILAKEIKREVFN